MIMAMRLIVFVSAQSAGRLFEDPFWWFMIGLQLSIIKLAVKEKTEKDNIYSRGDFS